MTTLTTTLTITCSGCQLAETETEIRQDGSPKIPRRWKLICGEMTCPDCTKQWITRAVTWSVDRVEGITWTKYFTECNVEFSKCGRMANEMMRHL